MTKELLKSQVDLALREMGEKARKGEQIKIQIPELGTLEIRMGIAGVHFDRSLIDSTAGKTTKLWSNTLFQINNNLMNQR
jgi:K+/H+ antiporter YhaU regulatory subunit KhtT